MSDTPVRDVDAWLAALRERHAELPVHEERIEVPRETYERLRADAERDALGGARVRLARDGELLLVSNRGEHGWDVPGGAMEPGESLGETARREVREETGVVARVTDAWRARHRTIVHRDDPDRRLHMLDVWFEAVAEDSSVRLDPAAREADEEILDARWFAEPPDAVHEPFEDRVAEWADG